MGSLEGVLLVLIAVEVCGAVLIAVVNVMGYPG